MKLVEGRFLERAVGLHCMSSLELEQLPIRLKHLGFVVPTGIDLPPMNSPRRDGVTIGVLARLHPIKNHPRVLDAVEELVHAGVELQVEFAGSSSDPAYAAALEARVDASPLLRSRVRFLGHVEQVHLGQVLARWSASVLVSDQENFGHAILTSIAHGVPVVSGPNIGLAAEVVANRAGMIATPGRLADVIRRVLAEDGPAVSGRARDLASRYDWGIVTRSLEAEMWACLRRRPSPGARRSDSIAKKSNQSGR
ncbi:MAG: glycosyltransferase family 4 protein [Myxococcaceae bacterium]